MRKKVFLIALIIITTLVVSSCNRENSIGINTENASESTENASKSQEIITDNQSEINIDNIKFNTVVYGSAEANSMFKMSKASEQFAESIYQDDSIDKIITIDVLGTEYEMNYMESAIMPRSDMRVNTYRYGDKGFKILMNADTGEIVECIGVPYEYDISVEQQYYMDLIKTLIPAKYSLESYECKVYTHYYEFGEDYMRSQEIEGFKICGENQELVGYRFSFSRKIGDVDFGNHISVEFSRGKLFLELYDFEYDDDFVKTYINDFINVQPQFENHILSQAKSLYNITDIENKSYTFFMKEGIPYIMVTSEVTFSTTNEPSITYTSLLKTITSFDITE